MSADLETLIKHLREGTGRVELDLERRLSAGAHRLRVVATDQLGNRRERVFTLRVP